MEANNVFGYFDYISDEISYKILSYLQPSQLFKASEINKRMNNLANDALLWKPFFNLAVKYDLNNLDYIDAKRIFHPSFSKMPSYLEQSLGDQEINKIHYQKTASKIQDFLAAETRHLVLQETDQLPLEKIIIKFALESQKTIPEKFRVIYVPLDRLGNSMIGFFERTIKFYTSLPCLGGTVFHEKKVLWVFNAYHQFLKDNNRTPHNPFLYDCTYVIPKQHKFLTIYNVDKVVLEKRIFEIRPDFKRPPAPEICSLEQLLNPQLSQGSEIENTSEIECPFSDEEMTLLQAYFCIPEDEREKFIFDNPEIKDLLIRFESNPEI